VNPKPTFEREDTQALRKKILNLSGPEARRLGLNKSTLHYLRKRARDRKPFRVYEPVLAKLSS
jgi:CRISPR-associated protein Cas1